MLLAWIIAFSLLGSVGAAAGAALLLVFPGTIRQALVPALVGYAAGVLLGAAFLGMIPTALARAEGRAILPTVLVGLVLFFLLEKLVLWRHCHDGRCEAHSRAAPLILIGDAFHNFVDGVVIAAAFVLTSHARAEADRRAIPIEVVLAVAAAPQQVVDGYGGLRARQSRVEFADGRL